MAATVKEQAFACVVDQKVFHMCWTSQRARPNSYRLMKSPITRSCICSVLEKQIVRRTNRLMRVRRLMCLLSIFGTVQIPVDSLFAQTQRYARFRQINCSLLWHRFERCPIFCVFSLPT